MDYRDPLEAVYWICECGHSPAWSVFFKAFFEENEEDLFLLSAECAEAEFPPMFQKRTICGRADVYFSSPLLSFLLVSKFG